MELDIVASIVGSSSMDVVQAASDHHNGLVDQVKLQLNQSNSAHRGLIIWLNSGTSCSIRPEPLHLRETIAFLKSNISYEADCCDVYDMFDLDIDVQYSNIVKMMWAGSPRLENRAVMTKHNNMDSVLQTMEASLLSGSLNSDINSAKLEDKMKEITATAAKVFEDIVSNRMQAPLECKGMAVVQ